MTTRRTPMKGRTMTSGRGSRAAVAPPKAALEACMTSEEFGRQMLRARKGARRLARAAQEQATAAGKVVARSMKEALAALKVATHEAARRVAAATAPERPAKATRRHAAG